MDIQGHSCYSINQLESGSKVGYKMIIKRHHHATSSLDGLINAPRNVELVQSQSASSSMTSSTRSVIEQQSFPCVYQAQTPQNGLQHSLSGNSKDTSETLTSSAICSSNKHLNCLSTVNHTPSFNLIGYPGTNTRLCNTSSVLTPYLFKNVKTYESSKPSETTNIRNNQSTVFSSSMDDQSCSTWIDAHTSKLNPTPNTSTTDLQSPEADKKTTVNQYLQCLEPTSDVLCVGPNEFKLTISLSPWDVSMQNVEWIYVDKTGLRLVLNPNTSFLLEHLYNTYSRLNSTITMKLPETGREYQIRPKDMEMTDMYSGEKIALFRKINLPDLVQPLQTGPSSELPLLWSPQQNDIELVTLDKKNAEYRTIRNIFLHSMPKSCVIGIDRIQNKKLFVRYAFQKAVLLDKNFGNGQMLNEKLLFHGTSTTPPSKIWQSEDGFDLRYSRRGMWGIGSYFAEKASYSDRYAYTYTMSSCQFREMLVANVLTGNSKQMPSNRQSRKLTRPPVYIEATASNPEVLYDSVTGETQGSRIYVLYKLDMAYPSYLVRYFKL